MTTWLDRIIERLRKKTKEAWFLYQRVSKNYAEYMTQYFLLHSMNLHWTINPIKEYIKLYRNVYNLHQQLIQDIGKLIPNVRYLTARLDDRLQILNDLEDKVNSMKNVNEKLIEMQNRILSPTHE
jgi:hypothetical protein